MGRSEYEKNERKLNTKRVGQCTSYYEKVENGHLLQNFVNSRKIERVSRKINQANAFDRDGINRPIY